MRCGPPDSDPSILDRIRPNDTVPNRMSIRQFVGIPFRHRRILEVVGLDAGQEQRPVSTTPTAPKQAHALEVATASIFPKNSTIAASLGIKPDRVFPS